MSRRLTAALLMGAALALPLAAHAAETLTVERVFADPDMNGPTAKGVAFSPDGTRVTYLKAKPEDQNVLDLWAADVKGGEPYRLVDAKALSPDAKDLTEAEKARRERQRISQRGVVEYRWDDQGRSVLVPLDGDLYMASVADGKVRRLTQTPGDEIDAKVSPKGRFASYVRDQNLYVTDLTSGREQALTADGKDTLSFGVAEFIAEEEMDRHTGYWWSPDETKIALTRVDESGVDVVPRVDIGASGTTIVSQRYPRAGRPNAVVDLFVHDMATGKKVQVDLGADKDVYLARVAWSKDGKTLYVQRQTRDQKRLDLLAVDPATGAAKIILTETAPHWVELNDDFKPLSDGSFLWASERSGNKHLYLYSREGKLLRQVTHGDWPVDKVEGVDEAKKLVLFGASKDTPLERQLYEVSYARSAEPKALTQGHGWWTTTVAKTGGAFTGTYSDPSTPPQTALYAADGKRVRWIEENKLDASHPYGKYFDPALTPTYGSLKAADGSDLYYQLFKPAKFDPAKKYPAIVLVYGGPHSQQVKRSWQSPYERLFLEAGFVVFRLDNRGSSNRSYAFKTALDRRLGTVEVDDQIVGIDWLKAQPFVDANRVGVTGWSYGGFMTLSLMSDPRSKLAAGISGAPPTDWTLYDTHYTEQFMGKPSENPEGYAAANVVNKLDKLNGDLLLMHGMADDNVVFENSTRVLAALQAKGRVFETMVYPGQRHSAGRSKTAGKHVWSTYLDFFKRKLKPEI
jgi:dipeptidyl-peptidase-4